VTRRIFGIDLGTTYSCIAYVDDTGRPAIIDNFEGQRTTPSVVHFVGPDEIAVGETAKGQAVLDPDRVVQFVKRNMGDPGFTFDVDGRQYRPEQISARILRKLADDASQALNEPVEEVVITCPAYFGINQREATKAAGEIAGLKVLHVLNEPTAAASFYGANNPDADRNVLVFDLGGGTFDITVISVQAGNTRVIVTGGDHKLGGKDWDDRLAAWIASEAQRETGSDEHPQDDRETAQAILLEAEKAKQGLSQRQAWPVMVAHAGKRVRVEVTREKFEELTADLLDRTIELTEDVLRQAEERGVAPDEILLVGGSSKMPAVAKRVEEAFGIVPRLFDPDLAVAKGAALVGLKLLAGEILREEIAQEQGIDKADVDLQQVDVQTLEAAAERASSATMFGLPSKDFAAMARTTFRDVCSHAFGVVAVVDDGGGEVEQVHHLILPNTEVPVEHTETRFGTLRANQSGVHLRIMEQAGQEPSPSLGANRLVVEGEIVGLPPNLPAGSPIHVTFRLGQDGILQITALEPGSGKELKLRAEVSNAMSREEIEESKALLLRTRIV
jgi:molecular chaperone DnaK (HSP70)